MIQFEWKYSPETYLERPILIEFDDGLLEIKDGVAIAIIDPKLLHKDNTIGKKLSREIENNLFAVHITTHKDFELEYISRADIKEDGTKSCYVQASATATMTLSAKVDVVVTDKDGNIVSDTKRERLEKQNNLTYLINKYRAYDVTLDLMLKSSHKSKKEPNNELVYLYEIRDALSQKFDSKTKAIHALGIATKEWDEIGKLANYLPLKQGRHRGKAACSLRDAKPAELEIARKSASHLIEKYLEFLEKNKKL